MPEQHGSLVLRDAAGEQRYLLESGSELICGSSRFVDIRTKGKGVARKHICFSFKNGVYKAESVGKNPFELNGQLKMAGSLKNGDVIRLGVAEILFYLVEGAATTAGELIIDSSAPESTNEVSLSQLRLHLDSSHLMVLERQGTRIEAIYSDGNRTELQDGFKWEVDPADVLIVNEDNELVPMKAGIARVGVRMGAFFDVVDVHIEDVVLEKAVIVMPDDPLYEGEERQLQVLGTWRNENGEAVQRDVTHLAEWRLTRPGIVEFDDSAVGVMRAVKPGDVGVKAKVGGVKSEPVMVNVGTAVLRDLSIRLESTVLEAGRPVPVIVEGVATNGSLRPYRESIQWEIEGDPCLTIADRMAEPLAPGRCRIKAFTAFLSSNVLDVTVTVTSFKDGTLILPDELAPESRARPTLRVLADNGHTYDVGPLVNYSVDNSRVLAIEDGGTIRACGEGFATLIGRFGDKEFVKAVKITPRPKVRTTGALVDLVPMLTEEHVPVGMTVTVTVTGVDSSGNQAEVPVDAVIMRSLSPNILRVSDGGVVGLESGEGVLKVSHGDIDTELRAIVTPACLVRLAFDPPKIVCPLEEKRPVRALALYSDGREVDITHKAAWKVPRGLIGSPKGEGLEPLIAGEHTIECRYAGLSKILLFEGVLEEEAEDSDDPNRFGDLKLSRIIGVGGMGRVFLAHRDADSKAFAVKVVRKRFLKTKSVTERFIREARLLSNFHHENIVRVYRYGKKDDKPYLVMEHLEGDTFSHILRERGPLSPVQTVSVIRDLARALHVLHSHEAGVVHRDIKPGNIFLTTDGVVKLMDFGIIREGAEQGPSAQTGVSSKILGTANYVSPEQIRTPHEVDGRSDLYSLGITMFALIAGQTPFQGKTGLEVVLKHINEPPPRLSDLAEGLPPGLDDLVNRLLSKRREDRPATAAEVALALELMSAPVDLRDCFV